MGRRPRRRRCSRGQVMTMISALLAAAVSFAPQGPLSVEITLKGKEPVTATWTATPVAIDTEFGSATVKAQKLWQMQFGPPDVVVTEDGTELKGEVRLRAFDVKVDGKPRHFGAAELQTIVVVRDGRPLGGASFGGDWMTTFGPMHLEQHGMLVQGSYGFGDTGKLDGKLKDGVLAANWRNGGASGTAKIELLAKDDAFTARFAGGNGEEFCGGYRRQALAAKAVPGQVASGQTKSGMRYHVRLPKGHAEGKRWPAICMLHGSNMDS